MATYYDRCIVFVLTDFYIIKLAINDINPLLYYNNLDCHKPKKIELEKLN